ncbi:MAG: class I SAM-dependent methyltransferase [Oscillospiraceae bacterium]|nr:class I SAM-dependent methyltransferase [Oscillospiraceae bacterium]
MASIHLNHNQFYLTDHQGVVRPLFHWNELFQNKSRIPLHSLDVGQSETISQMLLDTASKSKELLSYAHNESYLSHIIVDCLLSQRLMTTCAPAKVLEMGCGDGKLSYHLAHILGKFHPDSLLCLLEKEITNDERAIWLDTIAASDCSPEISVVISDYPQTNLADNAFDIIVINQINRHLEPISLMQEVRRLIRKHGLILCLYDNDPLIESSFKLAFPKYTPYTLSPFCGVLAVELHEGESFFDGEKTPNSIDYTDLDNIRSSLKNKVYEN